MAAKRAAITITKKYTPTMPVWVHGDVAYWKDTWQMLRDFAIGEIEVKNKGTDYLPKFAGMDADDYAGYWAGAVFFNMVGRTINGLLGTLFRRKPVIENLPPEFTSKIAKIWRNNLPLEMGTQTVAQEIIHMGRVGVLVDRTNVEKDDPYFAYYIAENILDWKVGVIGGRQELTEVVLREIRCVGERGQMKKYIQSFRVLSLIPDGEGDWMYVQDIYEQPDIDATLSDTPRRVVPENRGVPWKRIPFRIFGAYSNSIDVEKSPIYDIATLNGSHYRSYAHLEHARFYVGMPVYYAPVSANGGQAEYVIGPNKVWEVPNDGGQNNVPGIIEMNGQGLKFLENALDQKEQQIASLGGRLLGVRPQAVAESDNIAKMKDRNEQSLLLNVSNSIDNGITELLRIWLMWQDVSQANADKVTVEINKDFLFDNASAREFRAIAGMYKDGHITISVLFDYMKRAEVIPDWMSEAEYVKALENAAEFPNNPDFEARQQGYSNAAEMNADQFAREQLANTDKLAKRTLDATNLQNKQAQDLAQQQHDETVRTNKAGEKTAAVAAKKPVVVAKPGAGGAQPKK